MLNRYSHSARKLENWICQVCKQNNSDNKKNTTGHFPVAGPRICEGTKKTKTNLHDAALLKQVLRVFGQQTLDLRRKGERFEWNGRARHKTALRIIRSFKGIVCRWFLTYGTCGKLCDSASSTAESH